MATRPARPLDRPDLDVLVVGAGPTGLTLAGQMSAMGATIRAQTPQAAFDAGPPVPVRTAGFGAAAASAAILNRPRRPADSCNCSTRHCGERSDF
jgi:flavin-dependent dehydrogenase